MMARGAADERVIEALIMAGMEAVEVPMTEGQLFFERLPAAGEEGAVGGVGGAVGGGVHTTTWTLLTAVWVAQSMVCVGGVAGEEEQPPLPSDDDDMQA